VKALSCDKNSLITRQSCFRIVSCHGKVYAFRRGEVLPRRRAIGIQVKAASVSFKLMERLFAYLAGVQVADYFMKLL